MARINLLPWREERREAAAQTLSAGAGGCSGRARWARCWWPTRSSAAPSSGRSHVTITSAEQIAVVDERIKQISDLKARRQQLVERMRIIQDLQGNRPISGRIFRSVGADTAGRRVFH